MFGQRVTPQEKAFLTRLLTETTRLEQGKYFKAIYATAKRNNVSLQVAAQIFENNKKTAKKLGYKLNKFGEVINNFGEKITVKDVFQSSSSEKRPKSIFNSFKEKVKKGLGFLKSAFSIY